MPYSSQDSMEPTDHGFTSSFEQVRTDVTDASYLSTLQLCHSLFYMVRFVQFRQWVDQHPASATLQSEAVRLEDPP